MHVASVVDVFSEFEQALSSYQKLNSLKSHENLVQEFSKPLSTLKVARSEFPIGLLSF